MIMQPLTANPDGMALALRVKAMNVFKFGTADEDPRCKAYLFYGRGDHPDGKTIYTEWDGQKVPLKYEPNAPEGIYGCLRWFVGEDRRSSYG